MVLRLYLILRVKTHLTTLRVDGWGIGKGRGLRQVPPTPASGSRLPLNPRPGFLCTDRVGDFKVGDGRLESGMRTRRCRNSKTRNYESPENGHHYLVLIDSG